MLRMFVATCLLETLVLVRVHITTLEIYIMAEIDPYRAFNFILMFDGEEVGRFVSCSGMRSEVVGLQSRESGAGPHIRHRPNQPKFPPMV
jgi:hypothetical protein